MSCRGAPDTDSGGNYRDSGTDMMGLGSRREAEANHVSIAVWDWWQTTIGVFPVLPSDAHSWFNSTETSFQVRSPG